MLLATERDAVAQACKRLSREGLVVGTAGNVSVRAGDRVAISPSGVSYEEMTAADVGVHDLSGVPIEAPLAPSSELPLHLSVYAGSDHRAIVHTHSLASSALSTVVDVVPAGHYYTAMFGGPVRVARYATFGSHELAENVTAALADRTAALMSNHGAVLVGTCLDELLVQTAYLEYICEIQLRAGAYPAPQRVLDDAELAKVAGLIAGYGQTSTSRSS
ncbi:MAG: class II aldolase/adducin family protein [Micrococcales bacterium]|nr:class II aldolase/adducin family protein [Micrococcales bacterium]